MIVLILILSPLPYLSFTCSPWKALTNTSSYTVMISARNNPAVMCVPLHVFIITAVNQSSMSGLIEP